MKIAVINGSPKGEYSITLQSVYYLQRKFPEHEFCVLHAGQRIKALEKDFSQAKTLIEESDAVLFSYPVYTFLAPWQLHRFIELAKECGVNVPVRVDHVPLMAGEEQGHAGYTALGRLYAIGYLKGILQTLDMDK